MFLWHCDLHPSQQFTRSAAQSLEVPVVRKMPAKWWII
jgi:hypothetical protein